jgi:hypothetical protein
MLVMLVKNVPLNVGPEFLKSIARQKDFKADTTLRLTVLKMRPRPGKAYPTAEGFEPLGDIWSFRVRLLTRSFGYFEALHAFTCMSG